MNLKGKGAYVVYVTAFEMIFDVAKIVIIFQSTHLSEYQSKTQCHFLYLLHHILNYFLSLHTER